MSMFLNLAIIANILRYTEPVIQVQGHVHVLKSEGHCHNSLGFLLPTHPSTVPLK